MNENSKQKIIIFEGHDRAGKTTIAKELAKQCDFQYFKSNSQKFHFKNDDFHLAVHYEGDLWIDILNQLNFGNGIILDRFVGSEVAYSTAFKRPTVVKSYLDWVDKQLQLLNTKIIYCFKNDFHGEFHDDCISLDRIQEIKFGYELYFNSYTELPNLRLDTTNEDLEEQIKIIKDFIQWEKQ